METKGRREARRCKQKETCCFLLNASITTYFTSENQFKKIQARTYSHWERSHTDGHAFNNKLYHSWFILHMSIHINCRSQFHNHFGATTFPNLPLMCPILFMKCHPTYYSLTWYSHFIVFFRLVKVFYVTVHECLGCWTTIMATKHYIYICEK